MYSSSTGLQHSLEIRISLPLVGTFSDFKLVVIYEKLMENFAYF